MEFLTSSLQLLHAEMGYVQVVDDSDGCLRIVAHQGFKQPFLDFFKVVTASTATSCILAKTMKKRVIVEDVTKSPIFVGTPALVVLLEAGVRACQSTPLVTRSGEIIGVISTHYPDRFVPTESDLQNFDLFVRETIDRLTEIRNDFNESARDENEELGASVLEEQAQLLPKEELDRDIAELSADVDFMEGQIKAELSSYSTNELSGAHRKIARFSKRLEILKKELANRK